jgi:hypothetical protein
MKTNHEVTIMNFAEDELMFDDLLLKALKDNIIQQNVKTKYVRFLRIIEDEWGDQTKPSYLVDNSAILLFDSIKTLIDFIKIAFLTNSFPKPLKFYVHLHLATIEEIKTVAEARKDFYLNYFDDKTDITQYLYFIMDEEKSIKLLTFDWYTPQACHLPQLIEINRFDKKKKKWNKSEFSIIKCRNFHGCKLLFQVENSFPEFYFDKSKDSPKIEGYGLETIDLLSESLNFKFHVKPRNDAFHNDLHVCDLILKLSQPYCRKLDRDCQNHFVTTNYFMTTEFVAVPPGAVFDGNFFLETYLKV